MAEDSQKVIFGMVGLLGGGIRRSQFFLALF
jgi:hypothetical protein